MNRRDTILAASLLALAVAFAISRHSASPAEGSTVTPRKANKPVQPHRATAASGRYNHREDRRAARDDERQAMDSPIRSSSRAGSARSAGGTFSRAELERRALLVEQDANHELDRLIPLLGLSPAQQDRVFQTLARTSPNFVPGMQVGGAPLEPPPEGESKQALLAELSDDQIATYLQDSDEGSAWWSEYVTSVASQLENGTPEIGSDSGVIAAAPAAGSSVPDETAPASKENHVISEVE